MRRLCCFGLLLLLAGPALGQGAAPPSYEPTACPFEGASEVEGLECGALTVPERRDTTGGRMIRLAVAVLRSHNADPAPDPLVFLSGGPGAGSVEQVPGRAQSPFWDRLRQERDLIFYDQRGTGYSEPAFCREMDVAFTTASYRGMSAAEMEAEWVRAAGECRERMEAEGVDLTAYHSAASARDLADLRQALGYESWNLLGLSYGTRLALTALRDAPVGVRSVILDSAVPPDIASWADGGERFSRSLRLAFDQCAADPDCQLAFPTLEDDFYSVVADLEQDPVVLALPDTSRFPDGRVVLDGTLWTQGIFQGLYDRSFVPVFPLVVRESKRRNRDVLRALAEGIAPETDAIRWGMNYAVTCYEEAPFSPPDQVRADQRRHPGLAPWFEAGDLARHAVCDVLHEARADSTEFYPVRSDVPALVIGGEFDPITPPDYGRRVAQTLSNATFVEVTGLGHGTAPFTDCTRDLIDDFLDDPERSLDISCAGALPPASFVTDVHLNGGVYRMASALQGGMGPLVGLGLLSLVLLSAVVGWPAAALVRRLRERSETAPTAREHTAARAVAVTAAVLALVFLVGLVVTVLRAAAENPYVLAFGVPGEAAWLFVLPWVVAVLTLGVVVFAVLAWRRGWWTRAGRAHYAAVAGACLGFIASAALWGLL